MDNFDNIDYMLLATIFVALADDICKSIATLCNEINKEV